MIRDKQMKITWHFNEFKLYNSVKDIVDVFAQLTKKTYEDVTKIRPSRGKIHDYPSMTLDYTTSIEVKVYMKE